MSRRRIGKTKGKETPEGFSRLGISHGNVFRSFVSAQPVPATLGRTGRRGRQGSGGMMRRERD